jgi:O-antigen ligase
MMHTIRRKIPGIDSGLLRLVILGGLMVGLMGIGFASTRVPPELILIAVVVPPTIVLALTKRLEYGVLAIILAAGFVRYSLPTGTESRIVISLLMTALFIVLWIVQMLTKDRKLRLNPSHANVPLLAFILTAVISYVWSNAFRDPLVVVWRTWPFVQLGGLAVIILLPGALLLTANVISEVRWLKLLHWSMILIGVLALADYFLALRLSFLNIDGLFSLWFVSLSCAQALFNKKLFFGLRLTLLGLAVAWMAISIITRVTWLAGWLPSLAAVATICLLKSKRLFLIFLLFIVVYVALNWGYYVDTVWTNERTESGESRLQAWAYNWQVTGKHFLFGTGPAGYALYYMSYSPDHGMATHSNYIDILSQMGIVGLFFCVWFFGALGWAGYKLYIRLRGQGDFSAGFAAATLAGWVGCILAMGLGDWLFPFVYTQTIAGFDYAVYNWVLLGGMLALSNMHTPTEVVDV